MRSSRFFLFFYGLVQVANLSTSLNIFFEYREQHIEIFCIFAPKNLFKLKIETL